ncbi:MAG TPA: hypothetical protein VF042_15650, partial [Gemmatimonadaceae bacterium]
ERVAFEKSVLYPLAGLAMVRPDEWQAYFEARSGVLGATSTIARDYLEKKITAEQAQKLFGRYRLMSASAASQLMPMVDWLGSYIIASDLGWMTIDRALRSRPVAEQWQIFGRLMREPVLLGDIAKLGQ